MDTINTSVLKKYNTVQNPEKFLLKLEEKILASKSLLFLFMGKSFNFDHRTAF